MFGSMSYAKAVCLTLRDDKQKPKYIRVLTDSGAFCSDVTTGAVIAVCGLPLEICPCSKYEQANR